MFKKLILTGLLVLVPIGITVWILHFLVSTLDRTILLLPMEWRPMWRGDLIPGLGVLLAFLIVLVTGAIGTVVAKNVLGNKIAHWWSEFLQRIPVVGGIYKSVKQLTDPVLSENGQAFSKAVLVEFPHASSKTIAFLTNQVSGEVATHLTEPHVSVYVPTTPNPTSGYMLILPKSKVWELEMSVDQALKYVVSMGVAAPPPLDVAVNPDSNPPNKNTNV